MLQSSLRSLRCVRCVSLRSSRIPLGKFDRHGEYYGGLCQTTRINMSWYRWMMVPVYTSANALRHNCHCSGSVGRADAVCEYDANGTERRENLHAHATHKYRTSRVYSTHSIWCVCKRLRTLFTVCRLKYYYFCACFSVCVYRALSLPVHACILHVAVFFCFFPPFRLSLVFIVCFSSFSHLVWEKSHSECEMWIFIIYATKSMPFRPLDQKSNGQKNTAHNSYFIQTQRNLYHMVG